GGGLGGLAGGWLRGGVAKGRRLGGIRRSGTLLARRLAAELRGSGALLRPRRIRARRFRQGRQRAGKQDRRRQRVRSAAPSRLPAAAAALGPGRHPVRSRDAQARLSPVLDAARDPLAPLSPSPALHLLRL